MRRATVYFEDDLHKALKLKAAAASASISDLVNQAIRESLAEDFDDLQAFRERENEPTVDFETFLKGLKRDGRLQGRNQAVGREGTGRDQDKGPGSNHRKD